MLERELQRVNRIIDEKIVRGLDYSKEARDHRLILRRVRYHTRRTLGERLVNFFFKKNVRHMYA